MKRCTTAITCIHISRPLEPSIPLRGNRSGATIGKNHIIRPKKKNPEALPVFIDAAH
jgi:hypothetical protein